MRRTVLDTAHNILDVNRISKDFKEFFVFKFQQQRKKHCCLFVCPLFLVNFLYQMFRKRGINKLQENTHPILNQVHLLKNIRLNISAVNNIIWINGLDLLAAMYLFITFDDKQLDLSQSLNKIGESSMFLQNQHLLIEY